MWMTDMNGTLVNMDKIMCMLAERAKYKGLDCYIIEAHEACRREHPLVYYFGNFETKEEAEEELAKIRATLMS